jgi:hypothetical protein
VIPNIGPSECRRRTRFGAVFLGIGILVAVGLIVAGAPRGWRATVLLPFWLAGLGFFQARDKT